MNEILELLPIPESRDLPPEQLEARRAALVAAIRADAADEPLARRVIRLAGKAWLTLLGIPVLGIALLTLGFSVHQRPAQRDAVAVLAAAGTVQIITAAAPGLGLARSFSASAELMRGQRTTRLGEAIRRRTGTR